MKMNWHGLLAAAGYDAVGADVEVTALAYDSRKVVPGSVFVCWQGEAADGHDFIAAAVEKGACAVVCERDVTIDVPCLVVDGGRVALAKLASAFYGFPERELKIIGVTGTNGKTTSTHLVHHILNAAGCKTALMGTNHILIGDTVLPTAHTTPEALDIAAYLRQMVDAGCGYLVMEVSSHALKQGRVAALNFAAVAFTNLTRDHLDYHKTFDDYLASKQILFKQVASDGCAVVNGDSDVAADFLAAAAAPSVTYGLGANNDYRAENIAVTAAGTDFELVTAAERHAVETKLIGDFNVYNVLTAIALCRGVGVELPAILAALADAEQVPGRFQRIKEQFGPTVVVDYAHTPDGLENILQTAKKLPAKRIILVFGCGGDRDKTKRPIMGEIGGRYADYAIVTSDNPRTEEPMAIIRMVEEGVKKTDCTYEVICDRRDAIRDAILMADDDDIVVVAGKGHEDYQIVGTEKRHFDDVEEVRAALALC